MSKKKNSPRWFRSPQTTMVGVLSLLAISTQTLPIKAIATPTDSVTSQALQIVQDQNTELAQASPVLRIQEIRGTGTATIDGSPASEGSTLGVGQALVTGGNSTVRLRIEGRGGSIEVSEHSRLIVGTLSSGEIDLEIPKGQALFALASLPGINSASSDNSIMTAPKVKTSEVASIFARIPEDSRAQVRSGNDYNFRVRTPTGVAGVRGTSFGVDVGPNGQTGISGLSGSVVASSQNQDQLVNSGEYVTISPDSAPTLVEPTSRKARLKFLVRQTRGGNNLRIFGQVDRLDIVYINGQAIETDPDGNFAVIMERPTNRSLRFVVRGPAAREGVYVLPVR